MRSWIIRNISDRIVEHLWYPNSPSKPSDIAGEEDTAKEAAKIHQLLAPANAAFDWRATWAILVHGLRVVAPQGVASNPVLGIARTGRRVRIAARCLHSQLVCP